MLSALRKALESIVALNVLKTQTNVKKLYAETCKKKYDVENISQYEGTKKKKKNKALAKYGVKCVSQAQEVKDKIAATNIKRYGAKIFLASEAGIAKRKETCLEHYGVDSFSKTPMHKEKTIKTNREKFGVDFISQDPTRRRAFQKRYTYKNINFDSIPEIALYIWLEDHKIPFEYQPNIKFEYKINGQICHYEPDFLIEGQVIEIKGDHFFKDRNPTKEMINPFKDVQDGYAELKHQCMLRNNVKILTSKDYKKYIDYVKATYGKDFLCSLKNK